MSKESNNASRSTNLFWAEPIENGYSCTITSMLRPILLAIENLYGPRKHSEYQFLGIEFSDDGPQLWYPEGGFVVIQLAKNALDNRIIAYWQLAHEAVHLLSPSGCNNSNVLEEGIASYFQDVFILNKFGIQQPQRSNKKYIYVESLVIKLFQNEGFDIIKNIRKKEQSLKNFSFSLMHEFCKNTDDEMIKLLLTPFTTLEI